MKFIDTHTHLYDESLREDREAMMQRAIAAGVSKMYMPNCDSSTIKGMLEIEDRWKQYCYAMMGLHPCYVKEHYQEELQLVAHWLEQRKFYAVGEIGIDKYWDLTFLEQQKDAFRFQIDLALTHQLPVVIHSREATQDCIDIVREKQNGNLRGIFHCFSGSAEEAKQIIDLGCFLGIGGVVTFKKSNLPEVVKAVGIDRIVLETDAPYLAPVPHRGKRNESSYIPLVAKAVAAILGMPLEDVARLTTDNAEKVFGN